MEGAIAKRSCSFLYQKSTNASDFSTKHISNQEANLHWVSRPAFANLAHHPAVSGLPAEAMCALVAAALFSIQVGGRVPWLDRGDAELALQAQMGLRLEVEEEEVAFERLQQLMLGVGQEACSEVEG